MYGVLVHSPSVPEFAKYTASLCSSRSRLKQRRTHNRAQICWLNRWCTSLLILLSCGLLLALSGCGNPQVNAGNTGTLVASPNTVTFGSVSIGQSASTTVSLANGNSAPVEISQLSMTGQSFSVTGTHTLPVTIAAGETYNLNVQFNPATEGAATGQLTIASNSSTNATAAITLNGTGTAGTTAAALTALSCNNSSITGSGTDACTVTLNAAAPSKGLSVSLSSSNAAVTVPATVTVPANATSAGFTATVSSVSTAQTVALTANAGGVSESFSLTLGAATATTLAAAPTITWAAPAAISYGTALSSAQLDASATVAGAFSYSPAAGTVLAAGTHTITATFTPTDTTDYATATTSVSITVNASAPAITWAAPAAIPYGTALGSVQLDASSTVAGTFSYSPAAGTVLAAGTHAITATFTPTDTTDYATATTSVSIIVNASAPAIAWAAPAAISYGTALGSAQLDASSTVAGTFSYSPTAGTVLTAGTHTITATFTPTDTDYATATTSVSITVNASAPAIAWAAPAAISYGTALGSSQLNASSTVAGAFSYSPAAGTVLAVGTHTIAATFTPTDTADYATATTSVSITVNATAPAIAWAAPAAISYGTALSSVQLDASSTIPGTFVYSPVAGTVLAVGSQTLSVTFTPTDTTDYATATQAVTLTVNQGISTLSISAASVPFGNVEVNTAATQTVTLTSTGTSAVMVNSATLTGTGFTVSGATFPVTLSPGQTATLDVQFEPIAAGAATGQLTVTSNSTTNGTAAIGLSGTGTAPEVDLSWDAPSSSSDPIAGYNVYRTLSGSSTYELLNSSVDTETAYVDNTVQSGLTYDYIVESLDDSGAESVPSNTISMTIP